MTVEAKSKTGVRAVVRDAYGETAEVLRNVELERPSPGDDEVLVRVVAAGVDPSVWHLMNGRPYLVRAMGFGMRRPKVKTLGSDLAGVVEAVGRNVSEFRPGDHVFGVGRGSFAEFACARADRIAPMPANVSFEQAASVPISGVTALQGLRDFGRLQAGQAALIIGAGGGVGTFAVQIAKAWGAMVTGVCSSAKTELVHSLGADHVIDYTKEEITDSGRRYDLILDTGGRRSLTKLRRALTKRGSLVLVGGEGGGKWFGGTDRQLRALLLTPFVDHSLRPMFAADRQEDQIVLKELIESGRVTPVVDRTYPLSEARAAIDYVASGQALGKVVIKI